MAVFYTETDRRQQFDAPQYTRTRHRYRGPRETEKINLEIDQFTFSVRRLYEKYGDITQLFYDHATLLLEGGDSGVNDVSETPVVLPGTETLSARLEELRKRLDHLEA